MRKDIDGIVVSWPLYHVTLNDRIDSILQHGLLPAKDFKHLGFEQPYPSDDNFIYLFNSNRMQNNLNKSKGNWFDDKEILKVNLTNNHQIEREYDQATIPLKLSGEALGWFLQGRKQDTGEAYVQYYFEKTYGIQYTGQYSIKDILSFIDSNISNDEWDEKDGCYRTSQAILPEQLKVISIEDICTP